MTSGADDALAAHELDLVTRASQGDDAAFDRFFGRNAAAVQLLAERLLGPGEAADAVVVEAFQKTVRRLPLLGARNSSPALYVLSTARNGAYAALGRQRPAADGGPLGALLSLPSRQRELLALRELGLPEAECAEVAGIEPREVGVQVARARLRLTDELEGLTLSTVFADDRAELLLAAEVVRAEGAPLSDNIEREITRHADEDSRFAAALSAVRSPSRSVGQLPAVTGAARLAAAARSGAVGTARPAGPASTAARAAAGAVPPTSAAVSPSIDPVPPRARPKSDPYDDSIGDELAWGIVDGDDDDVAPSGTAGAPAVEAPTDGQWEDGAGAISSEPSPPPAPGAAHPPAVTGPHAPAPSGDPSLADPFAGWDDALDWGDDDKQWGAGPASAAGAAAGAADPSEAAAHPAPAGDAAAPPAARPPSDAPDMAPPPELQLEETRPFDAVAAGLADPDPLPLSSYEELEAAVEAPRRSRWKLWLVWLIAGALLFVGAAFATVAIINALRDPTLPPASTLDKTTPTVTRTPTSSPKATPGSSSTKKKQTSSSSSAASKKTTSTASTASTGSAATSSTTTRTSSSGNTGGTASTGTGTSGTGTSSATKKKTTSATSGTTRTGSTSDEVVSGETNSGGSVRGGSGDGGTTP